jgi:hypothetical protein
MYKANEGMKCKSFQKAIEGKTILGDICVQNIPKLNIIIYSRYGYGSQPCMGTGLFSGCPEDQTQCYLCKQHNISLTTP